MTEWAALEWSFHPWRDARTLMMRSLVAGGLCVTLAMVAAGPGLVRWALVAAAALSFAGPLVPVECRLDEGGIVRRTFLGVQQRTWDQVRRARVDAGGIRFSPFTSRHWLDAFRTLELPLPAGAAGLADRARELLRAHGL